MIAPLRMAADSPQALQRGAPWEQGVRAGVRTAARGVSVIPLTVDELPRLCRDLMVKNPVCCLASDPVAVAAHRMHTANIGLIPIVESLVLPRLLGSVTDRDLVIRVIAEHREAADTAVGTVMTANPISCGPDDSLHHASALMEHHRIPCLPIVDDRGTLVGTLAQADLTDLILVPHQTTRVLDAIAHVYALDGLVGP